MKDTGIVPLGFVKHELCELYIIYYIHVDRGA